MIPEIASFVPQPSCIQSRARGRGQARPVASGYLGAFRLLSPADTEVRAACSLSLGLDFPDVCNLTEIPNRRALFNTAAGERFR